MGTHQAERALALLRIAVGLWLLRTAMGTLVWTPWPWASPLWVQAVADTLAQHAFNHPAIWVRYMLQQFLLPNVDVYAGMMVNLHLLAGLSLTLGLLVPPGALLGLVYAGLHLLLGHYQGDVTLGYYAFQVVAMVLFIVARAGRMWGVDAVLAHIRSSAWLW